MSANAGTESQLVEQHAIGLFCTPPTGTSAALYGRKRYGEFVAFLNRLAALIENDKIDVLVVVGCV